MKYIILILLMASVLLLAGCTNVNNGVGNIFNSIWGSKLTPYIVIGIIVFYILKKRSER